MSPSTRRAAWLAAAAVLLLSLNLRPGATSVGPLMAEILAALGQDATWGGLLAALPGVCFAVFGSLAVAFALRVGVGHALWLGMLASAVGLGLRPFVPDASAFLALTVLAFAGMAVGNVLVPAFIKRHFPHRIATMMTAYSTLLAVGATVASALAIPLARTLPGGWQASLATWGVAAALTVVPMLVVASREPPTPVAARSGGRGPSMLRSRRAVALGLFFGIQSLQAYTQFGWMAQMYRDGGLAAESAGLLVSLIASFGILTGLVMPTIVHRVADLRPIIAAFGVLLVVGYLGVLYLPTTLPWLWATSLGLSSGTFPMALALVTARSRDPEITARLSGFAQSIGYALAALGPFTVGLLRAATGGWTVPLWALAATSLVMVGAGFAASAPGHVDDDLDTSGTLGA